MSIIILFPNKPAQVISVTHSYSEVVDMLAPAVRKESAKIVDTPVTPAPAPVEVAAPVKAKKAKTAKPAEVTVEVDEGYTAKVVKNTSIVILKDGKEVNRFSMEDQAEYDSWNLSYYGPIKGITANTVLIHQGKGYSSCKRLKLAEFVRRNKNFKLEQVAAENSLTAMSL